MTPRIPREFSTKLIDWSPFVIMGKPEQQTRQKLLADKEDCDGDHNV
jgi:hypothetical protein